VRRSFYPWLEQVVADATAQPLPTEAQAYLAARGVAPPEVLSHRLGWLAEDIPLPTTAPPEFARWARRALYGRVIFPLCATRGDVIGLQTRSLDAAAHKTAGTYEKYLPQGASDLFPPVFGLPHALPEIWRTAQVVLVEGTFDYFAVRPFAPNTIAALTASIPQAVRAFLHRYAQRVTLLLDMDEAGRGGVDLVLRTAPEGLLAYAPHYRAHDPADLVQEGYVADLMQLVTPARLRTDEL
jgi:DNA primase